MEEPKKDIELNHLFWKDEILQVMYWMWGEKLGTEFLVTELISLLNTTEENLSLHLKILVDEGYIKSNKSSGASKYSMSDMGKKEAGQRFAGAFQGLQKAGHGECSADCDCQWEGKGSCKHHIHDENCDH